MIPGLHIDVPGGATRVLLHACCAPCSSAIVECLMNNGIRPVIFYSNSNIFPLQEYEHRLNECLRYAKKWGLEIVGGFEVLPTTLASSRWKNLDQVNEAGRWACSQVQGVTWWDQNWRKGGLQERRNQIIKEEKFYNQLYCGCEYSQKKPGQ